MASYEVVSEAPLYGPFDHRQESVTQIHGRPCYFATPLEPMYSAFLHNATLITLVAGSLIHIATL